MKEVFEYTRSIINRVWLLARYFPLNVLFASLDTYFSLHVLLLAVLKIGQNAVVYLPNSVSICFGIWGQKDKMEERDHTKEELVRLFDRM